MRQAAHLPEIERVWRAVVTEASAPPNTIATMTNTLRELVEGVCSYALRESILPGASGGSAGDGGGPHALPLRFVISLLENAVAEVALRGVPVVRVNGAAGRVTFVVDEMDWLTKSRSFIDEASFPRFYAAYTGAFEEALLLEGQPPTRTGRCRVFRLACALLHLINTWSTHRAVMRAAAPDIVAYLRGSLGGLPDEYQAVLVPSGAPGRALVRMGDEIERICNAILR